jgi:hypothetical protein
VALYAIFTRLTQAEEMPRFEQLRYGLMARLARLGMILAAIGTRLHFRLRLRRRQRMILFYPLAIALAVTGMVFAAKSSTDKHCLPSRTATAKNVARTSLCRPQNTLTPVMFGR